MTESKLDGHYLPYMFYDKRVHILYIYGSKQHSLQVVELSQWTQTAVQIVPNLPAPVMGARFTVFEACGPAGWLALLLTKAGGRDQSRSNNFKQESLDL